MEELNADCLLWTVKETVPGFENFSEACRTASPELERQETKATDHMVMYFTSGTSGYPKGVIHDFTYPLAHYVTARYWQQAEDGGLHFTISETGWAKASWESCTDSGLQARRSWFMTLTILSRSSWHLSSTVMG